ncbi:MAG: hypothetical protein ACOCQD_00605 [archaeon]
MSTEKVNIEKWKKKIKKPSFWSKFAATGIGVAVASGHVPEPIAVMIGDQVSSIAGVLIAAGFGIWLGKDDEKEKQE